MSDAEPFLTGNDSDKKSHSHFNKILSLINIKNFIILVAATIFLIFVSSNYIDFQQIKSYSIQTLLNFQDNFLNDDINSNSNKSSSKITINKTNFSTKSDLKCEPLIKNYKHYRVKIDGVEYPRSVPLYLNKSINFKCLNKSKNIKKILYWNPFFGDWKYSIGLGKQTPLIKQNCPVTTCEFTNDKSLLNEIDFVIVHMRDTINEIPSDRPPNQRWIFTLYESPVHSGYFGQYNRLFNLTSTYRIDSDFPSFYETASRFYWDLNKNFNESEDFYAQKSELGAAVISNCGGSSKRLDYIHELQKYVKIDVFGKCGQTCPTKYKNSTIGNCKEIIATEYKFYLAFENSICKDYITEKFFLILAYNIVPIVLGGGVYDYYIPKSGFINVLDYPTPKHLADYLLYLDKNRTAYNSYFKWKKHIRFMEQTPDFTPLCNMCIQLQLESHFGVKKNIIEDIGNYWDRSKNCKSPQIRDLQTFNLMQV